MPAAYAEGGIDGLIIENHGDIPFLPPERHWSGDRGYMAVITERVREATGLPRVSTFLPTVRYCTGGGQGVRGRVHPRESVGQRLCRERGLRRRGCRPRPRYRATIAAEDVAIFADSHVKHGAHAITADRTVAELTRDLEFFDADAVIATGQRTGDAATPMKSAKSRPRRACRCWSARASALDNIGAIMAEADGVIIGSAQARRGLVGAGRAGAGRRLHAATFARRRRDASGDPRLEPW